MRPYDTVDVREVPVRRVRSVRELSSGRALTYRTRTGIIEGLASDPNGTLTIDVPSDVVGPDATVVVVDFVPS